MAQWEIFGNKARMTTAATTGWAVVPTGTKDHSCYALVTLPSTNPAVTHDWFCGTVTRWSDDQSFLSTRFLYQANSPEIELFEHTPQSVDLLMAVNLTAGNLVAGTTYVLETAVEGPDVAVYWGPVGGPMELVGQGSPVLLTGTKAGIGAGTNQMHGQPLWDDVVIWQTVAVAPPTTTRPFVFWWT